MSNTNPRDFFPSSSNSPALSLSLAGIFRGAAAAEERSGDVEERERTRPSEDTTEISSENSGPVRSRSEEDFVHNVDDDDNYDDDNDDVQDDKGKSAKKKRKKYHRHTAQQIREMEALFKESPHPDEKQRQQLSKQLDLHPRQVKFWFQNRRTQIKAIQERHENSLLKTELEKIKEENKSFREVIQKASCPNCGFASNNNSDTTTLASTDEQQLKIENARLKTEVDKLRSMVAKYPPGTSSPSASCSEANTDQESKIDLYKGAHGIGKPKIIDIVDTALEELKKMANSGEPLWVTSVETGRQILNYDEYVKEFSCESLSSSHNRRSIEASRESGVVFLDLPRLLQCFMDVGQWEEVFSCMVSKAAIVDVICGGEGPNKDGIVQLMFAELQMLTPLVSTREVYFVRHCKQLSPEKWAIVDVSIDNIEDSIDTSLLKYRKRPSGCIIEDKNNGHCKVTWVEHLDCQKRKVHSLYRTIVNSGLAFGAKHWMTTLQLQCERLVFFMATNVPTKDSTGVATLAGRKSLLKLAQRMTRGFCRAIGASSFNSWTKVTTKTGEEDVRVTSRKNLNDPGEPIGVILCAVSSVWLPVSPDVIFDFLRDDAHRHEWDLMLNGDQAQSIANLAKGQHRGNAVGVMPMKSNDSTWIIQDSNTNTYESILVFSPVNTPAIQSVITGCDSSNVAILPCGFSILADGTESRPLVLTSRQEQKNSEVGSFVTVALQVVINSSPTEKLTAESIEPVTALISSILRSIKTSMHCEDG